eukprot:13548319-Ditylum_brightwellii.AAC.1
MSFLLYMDSSLVFIVDTCWGRHKEPFIYVNKQSGERQLIGQHLKALNVFNDIMFAVDCWDLIRAPKHGKYSIEIYGCVDKWTVRFGDGLIDMQQANDFSAYRGVHSGNSKVRRHG